MRVKIGVGRDPNVPVEHFVLQSFRPDERDAVHLSIEQAARAVGTIVANGVDRAMNSLHCRKSGEPKS